MKTLNKIFTYWRDDLKIKNNSRTTLAGVKKSEKENIMELKEQIINDIESNPIVLYMKGTKDMPMCGFSSSVVQILNHYDVEFKDINVLEDSEIRVKLSEHSNWPTIPQLFINGELVGGADIAIEMHNSGELETILDTIK